MRKHPYRLIAALYVDGWSFERIRDALGCSIWTIKNALRLAGIPSRAPGRPR